jgi:hypothetical protein
MVDAPAISSSTATHRITPEEPAMIRKTIYATAVVTFGLVVGGSAYAVSAAERPAVTPRPIVTTAPSADDNGGRIARDLRTEPGDDRRSSATATPRSSATPHESSSPHEAGDDHGGRRDRDQRTEPGDDRRSKADRGRGDDRGGDDSRGRGSGGDDHGSDDRGRGSDDTRHG